MMVMGAAVLLLHDVRRVPDPHPAAGLAPAGYVPPAKSNAMITTRSVAANTALRTPQFWLLWLLLCLNTTAGIGIIETASPMVQDIFRGRVERGRRRRVRRRPQPLQHGRPVLLVQHLRQDRPQADLHDLLRPGRGDVPAAAARRLAPGQHRAVRGPVRRDPEHVRRRVRHHARLHEGPVRHQAGRPDLRPGADRLERRRRAGADAGERHRPPPGRGRRAASTPATTRPST